VVAAPLLAAFVLAPSWIMRLFGHEFSRGGAGLAIQAVGQFVNVATGNVGAVLVMTRNERRMRDSVTVGALINLVVCVALTPRFGMTGAARGTAAGLIASNSSPDWEATHLPPIRRRLESPRNRGSVDRCASVACMTFVLQVPELCGASSGNRARASSRDLCGLA